MRKYSLEPESQQIYFILEACRHTKNLEVGKEVHRYLESSRFNINEYIQQALFLLYAKCEELQKAREIFDTIPSGKRHISIWTVMIQLYTKKDLLKEALLTLEEMEANGVKLDEVTYTVLLKACARPGYVTYGRDIHQRIEKSGIQCDIQLKHAVLEMYAKSGCLTEAISIFDRLKPYERNLIAWNLMLQGYIQCEKLDEAVELVNEMPSKGLHPDSYTWSILFRGYGKAARANPDAAPKYLQQVKGLHQSIKKAGTPLNKEVKNVLIHTYAECGSLKDSWDLFLSMNSNERDKFTWSIMLAALAQQGELQRAKEVFSNMQQCGIQPDKIAWITLINACIKAAFMQPDRLPSVLAQAQAIHQDLLNSGIPIDLQLNNMLIDMYAKCGAAKEAKRLFESLPIESRDINTWNLMVGSLANQGKLDQAMEFLDFMENSGVMPDQTTWHTLIAGVLNSMHEHSDPSLPNKALDLCEAIHQRVLRTELFDTHLKTSLLTLYSKCGSTKAAQDIFESIPSKERDLVAWNAILGAFSQTGDIQGAMRIFNRIQSELKPNRITWILMLQAYAKCTPEEDALTLHLSDCKELHHSLLQSGINIDTQLQNMLIDMYGRHGGLEDAIRVFESMKPETQSLVTWNVMLGAYSHHGDLPGALTFFEKFNTSGFKPDRISCLKLLQACTTAATMNPANFMYQYQKVARSIHQRMLDIGIPLDVQLSTALIKMYGRCGILNEAHQIFEAVPKEHRDMHLWTSLMDAYAHQGDVHAALRLLDAAESSGLQPDKYLWMTLMKACAVSSCKELCVDIHNRLSSSGIVVDSILRNALVHMYAESANLEMATKVFDSIPPAEKDIIAWNTYLEAFAKKGLGNQVLELFAALPAHNVKPNSRTYVIVLNACSHSGLVDQALQIFNSMERDSGVPPQTRHYACVIDCLARKGRIGEAEVIASKMPKPNHIVWSTLLGACAIHNDVGRGRRIAEIVWELDPHGSSAYVLLSNMYKQAGEHHKAKEVIQLMKERGIRKPQGKSWTYLHAFGQNMEFLVNEDRYNFMPEIRNGVDELRASLEQTGYKFHCLDGESDAEDGGTTSYHCELLAMQAAIRYSPPGTPVHITKNLRMCPDCHAMNKHASKIYQREIAVKDKSRWHTFTNGKCDCGDYF